MPHRLLLLALCLAWGAPVGAFVPAGTDAADSRWTFTSAGSTGGPGNPVLLTWSFVPDGTQVRRPENTTLTTPSDLRASLDSVFGAGPGGSDLTQRPWFTYFEQAFERWSAVSGVTYVYEPNDSTQIHGSGAGVNGVRGDVRIGGIGMDGLGGTLAYNYFATDGGDMAIDTDDLIGLLGDPTNNFRGLRNVVMHEAGHGLGLDHVSSGDANFLMEATINTSFDGPQHDDLRGIHWLYGDALEKAPAGRNETAAVATPLGALAIGGSKVLGAGGSGSAVGPTETDFISIANENDDDVFSFSISSPVSLDLSMTPRGASYNQGSTPFNTLATADLALELLDADGVTVLATAASAAAGAVESIADFTLEEPGVYYARVRSATTAADQVVQFYRLDLAAAALPPDLLGDFNADGLVDAADYTVWRGENGLFRPAYTGADHTGDGVVNAADYGLWASRYGATASGSAVAVPETGATASVGALLVACASRRRRGNAPLDRGVRPK